VLINPRYTQRPAVKTCKGLPRRPVGVKWVLLVFRWTRFFSSRVATVATLPSALFIERFCSLGASWVFSFQPVLPPDCRPPVPFLEWKLGQAIDAVTGTRRLGFYLSFLRDVLPLCWAKAVYFACNRRNHSVRTWLQAASRPQCCHSGWFCDARRRGGFANH
jgi:hypothetical protein